MKDLYIPYSIHPTIHVLGSLFTTSNHHLTTLFADESVGDNDSQINRGYGTKKNQVSLLQLLFFNNWHTLTY